MQPLPESDETCESIAIKDMSIYPVLYLAALVNELPQRIVLIKQTGRIAAFFAAKLKRALGNPKYIATFVFTSKTHEFRLSKTR
jgi:hypothetical protein